MKTISSGEAGILTGALSATLSVELILHGF